IEASGTLAVNMETPVPLSPGEIMRGNSPNIVPSTVHKLPPGQRVELPSWLTDQPTTEMPAVHPSSLSGSAQLPAVPPGKSSPAEWQPPPARSAGKVTEPMRPRQTTGPQKPISRDTGARRASQPLEHQPVSPEWQPPPS